MVAEEKCKDCGAVLFRKTPLDQSGENWAVLDEDGEKCESLRRWKDGNEYYECPKCYKKNWIAIERVPGRGARTWISHVTE